MLFLRGLWKLNRNRIKARLYQIPISCRLFLRPKLSQINILTRRNLKASVGVTEVFYLLSPRNASENSYIKKTWKNVIALKCLPKNQYWRSIHHAFGRVRSNSLKITVFYQASESEEVLTLKIRIMQFMQFIWIILFLLSPTELYLLSV